MISIPLSRGMSALVDNDDHERLVGSKWFVQAAMGGKMYAARKVRDGGRWRVQYMHRVIMAAPPKMVVDHLNGDSLDNRKSNLRLTTQSANLRNSRLAIGRGAHFDKRTRRWFTRVSYEGTRIMLGRYSSEEMAHAAIHQARGLLESGVNPESVPDRVSAHVRAVYGRK